MPDVILPYAKAWAALLFAVLSGIAAVTDLPQWLAVASAVLSVIAVYGVPNAAPAALPELHDAGLADDEPQDA